MKKSYHSMVVPTVAAITALRNSALCWVSESWSYVDAVAMNCILPAYPDTPLMTGDFAE